MRNVSAVVQGQVSGEKTAEGGEHFVEPVTIAIVTLMTHNIIVTPHRGEGSEDKKRPVIIHRAMLGSVERMIAILTESYAGKWSVYSEQHRIF